MKIDREDRGKLICFEGLDGTGKSTQAQLLASAIDALSTRQPGGTDLGAVVRGLLLDPSRTVSPKAEALLMAADRAQHVDEIIRPCLERGRHVVCDRFIGSSVAYQGFGRRLGADAVESLSLFAVGEVQADLVILLDASESIADERINRALDRIEQEDDGFRARVREGFLAQAASNPEKWTVLSAIGTVDDVHRGVLSAVEAYLGVIPVSPLSGVSVKGTTHG